MAQANQERTGSVRRASGGRAVCVGWRVGRLSQRQPSTEANLDSEMEDLRGKGGRQGNAPHRVTGRTAFIRELIREEIECESQQGHPRGAPSVA